MSGSDDAEFFVQIRMVGRRYYQSATAGNLKTFWSVLTKNEFGLGTRADLAKKNTIAAMRCPRSQPLK